MVTPAALGIGALGALLVAGSRPRRAQFGSPAVAQFPGLTGSSSFFLAGEFRRGQNFRFLKLIAVFRIEVVLGFVQRMFLAGFANGLAEQVAVRRLSQAIEYLFDHLLMAFGVEVLGVGRHISLFPFELFVHHRTALRRITAGLGSCVSVAH